MRTPDQCQRLTVATDGAKGPFAATYLTDWRKLPLAGNPVGFELLIFDLDNTLLRTDAVKDFRGGEFVDEQPANYFQSLTTKARASFVVIYPQVFFTGLNKIRTSDIAYRVFTRAPRAYLDALLMMFYLGFAFVATVAAREVERTSLGATVPNLHSHWVASPSVVAVCETPLRDLCAAGDLTRKPSGNTWKST